MNNKLLQTKSFPSGKSFENCIFNIRGQQVMLDSDIADFFGVETKRLNEQMKRNIARFPEDFCFKLDDEETKTVLRSQNATSNIGRGGKQKLPFVYTEHGIIALSIYKNRGMKQSPRIRIYSKIVLQCQNRSVTV